MIKQLTTQDVIESLRRAQKLKDAGIIGQITDDLVGRKDGKICFCAMGAVIADRFQPRIEKFESSSYFTPEIMKIGYELRYDTSIDFPYQDKIIGLNDVGKLISGEAVKLSFGEIADELERLEDG